MDLFGFKKAEARHRQLVAEMNAETFAEIMASSRLGFDADGILFTCRVCGSCAAPSSMQLHLNWHAASEATQ